MSRPPAETDEDAAERRARAILYVAGLSGFVMLVVVVLLVVLTR